MKVKIFPSDSAFSKAIRESYNWTCQNCGTEYPDGQAVGAHRGLHCSHWFSRGKWATRFVVDNVTAHCMGCHLSLAGRMHNWFLEDRGEEIHQKILKKLQDENLGRIAKRNKEAIAKHYKEQYEIVRVKRNDGVTGNIPIVSWG